MTEEHWISLHEFLHFVQYLLCSVLQDASLALQLTERDLLWFTRRMDIAWELAGEAFAHLSVDFSAFPPNEELVPLLTEFSNHASS